MNSGTHSNQKMKVKKKKAGKMSESKSTRPSDDATFSCEEK